MPTAHCSSGYDEISFDGLFDNAEGEGPERLTTKRQQFIRRNFQIPRDRWASVKISTIEKKNIKLARRIGFSVSAIAQYRGVSKSCIYKILKSNKVIYYNLDTNKNEIGGDNASRPGRYSRASYVCQQQSKEKLWLERNLICKNFGARAFYGRMLRS